MIKLWSLIPKQVVISLTAFILVFVGSYILGLKLRIKRVEAELQRVALVADSTEAANAKAFEVRLSEDRVATGRRVVQAKQKADSLEKALGLSREANYALLVSLRSFQGQGEVVAEATPDSGLSGTFNLRQPPYTITGRVKMLPAPRPSVLNLRVDLDTLKLALTVGCGKAVNRIRPATVIVKAPPWATIGLPSLEQSPEVCQDSPAFVRPSTGRWAVIGKAAAMGGLAYGLARLLGVP